MEREYCVYILTNHSGTLYVGVTNDLQRRMDEHRSGKNADSFTARYRLDRLVYYECGGDIEAAISREKEIKRWRREKKIQLIESANPTWRDLSEDWPTAE